MNTFTTNRTTESHLKQAMREIHQSWIDATPVAQQTIIDIATDPETDPSLRLNASKFIIEHATGRAPNQVRIESEGQPWKEILADILVDKIPKQKQN